MCSQPKVPWASQKHSKPHSTTSYWALTSTLKKVFSLPPLCTPCAIGEPISRLNQLQPEDCTQLHHPNEAMSVRTADWRSSSWSHRRAPTYLRRSHMPLYTAHKRLPLWWQHSVESGYPPVQSVCKCLDFAITGIAVNEWRDISAAAFCCDALSRPPLYTTS